LQSAAFRAHCAASSGLESHSHRNNSGNGISVIPLCQGEIFTQFFARRSAHELVRAFFSIYALSALAARRFISAGIRETYRFSARLSPFSTRIEQDARWIAASGNPIASSPPAAEFGSEKNFLTQRYDRYTIAAVIAREAN
jgi:hypothetical protein